MSVINAVAEFERDLLIERTQAGLRRAKAEGKRLGRPRAMTEMQEEQALALRKEGASLATVAGQLGVSRSAIQRAEQKFADCHVAPQARSFLRAVFLGSAFSIA